MKKHQLKIKHEYFHDILNLHKRFEIRYDDRGYEVGDLLELHELVPDDHLTTTRPVVRYTGNVLTVRVNYIARNFEGLKRNWVVMSISRVKLVDTVESKMNVS